MNYATHYLYLSGGGDTLQSAPLDKVFFATIPRGGSLLYIPIALRGHRLFDGAKTWIRGVADSNARSDIQITTLNTFTDMSEDSVMRHSAIYIGGGNTWTLMHEIIESGFDSLLLRFNKHVGPIYGGSAGAIILGATIDTQDDKKLHDVKNNNGLGLTAPWSFACHYASEMFEHYKKWAQLHSSPILCIPENAGLVFDGAQFTCVGLGIVTVIHADGSCLFLNGEKKITLK